MKRRVSTVNLELNINEEKDPALAYRDIENALRIIEEAFGIEASIRGDKVFIKGEEKAANKAKTFIKELQLIRAEGYSLRPEDIKYASKAVTKPSSEERPDSPSLKELFLNTIPVSSKKRLIFPRSEAQKKYIEAIQQYDMVIGIGPAGTGKTYLAMAMAIAAFLKKQFNRIILARPAVEAGEKLGFLPGDMYEKVNPYLRPLYDALFDMMEADKAHKLIERGIIEIAPLAFMRGRTLNDSFIILDEAQNTTSEQMKMYLTRLGFNSKTVITGDITQVDLPSGKSSGLKEAEKILKDIKGVEFIYFTEKDVVRHKLVQQIIKAYEKFEKARNESEKQ